VKFDARPDQSVRYSGDAVEVHRAVAKTHAPAHHAKKHKARAEMDAARGRGGWTI